MSEFDDSSRQADELQSEATAISSERSGLSRRSFLAKSGAAGLGALALYATPKIMTVNARAAYSAATGVKTGPNVVITKTFGSLPETEFGGSGIPNHAVAITEITGLAGGISIKMGLTATQRFSNPAVDNDGAGNFTAPNGLESGAGKWNFNYYMKVTGGSFADCKFCLLYDFDPAVANAQSGWGIVDFNAAVVALGTAAALPLTTKIEDSQNSTFSWLDGAAPSYVTPPSHTPFSADALGKYGFALIAKDAGGSEIGRTEMSVNVVDASTYVPPTP